MSVGHLAALSMIHNATVERVCCACGKPFQGARNAKMCAACRNGEPGLRVNREVNARTIARKRRRMLSNG